MCSKVDLERPDMRYTLQVIECVIPLGAADMAWVKSAWKGTPSPEGITTQHATWIVNVVAVVTRTMFVCGELDVAVQIRLMDMLETALKERPIEPRFQKLRQQIREQGKG